MFPKKRAQNFTLCHIWYTSHRIQKLSFSNTSQISSLTLLCINHVLWSEAQTSHHNIPSFSMPVKKLCSLPEDGVPLTRTPTLPVSVSAQDAESVCVWLPSPCAAGACRSRRPFAPFVLQPDLSSLITKARLRLPSRNCRSFLDLFPSYSLSPEYHLF